MTTKLLSFSAALFFAAGAFAGTQLSGPVQTSEFSRHILPLETAEAWRVNLGVGGGVDSSPFITLFPDGHYVMDGTMYFASNSLTCGLQEVINAVMPVHSTNTPAGARILLKPGIYYTRANISTPNRPGQAFSLAIEGSGVSATAIVYTGNDSVDALTIGTPSAVSGIDFSLKHITVASCANNTTNIVYLQGYNDGAVNDGVGGGISKATIEDCFFTCWTIMTNMNRYGVTGWSSNLSPTQKFNLVGLNVDCNYNNVIAIKECEFAFLAVGLSYASDHGSILNNIFFNCGNQKMQNDWPSSQLYSLGGGMVFKNPQKGSFTSNANSWDIRANTCIECPIHVVSYFPVDGSGNVGQGAGNGVEDKWKYVNAIQIYEEMDESCSYLAVTSGNTVRFINPQNYRSFAPAPLPSLMWTTKGDYDLTHMIAPPTNRVSIVDDRGATNNGAYGFGGVLSANGIRNVASGWRGKTNAAPGDTTIRVHIYYTNESNPSQVFAIPAAQVSP